MARRTLRPRHTDEIRRKIQASQLINILMKHVVGEQEMTPTQIKAAEILLRKSIPDLTQVSGTGEDGAHIVRHSVTETLPFDAIRSRHEDKDEPRTTH